MTWPWKRDAPESGDTLKRAEVQADALAVRGHRVARSLEDRLARNHFATLVAQTMEGGRP